MTTEFETGKPLDQGGVTTSENDAVGRQIEENIPHVDAIEITLGSQLKAKRLQSGLDENHVATKLKIPVVQVQALEADDFHYFRSMMFARGFLRSYCRLLGLDHVAMIAAFDSQRASVVTTIKPVDKVKKQTHLGDPIVIFISVVIVAVLIFLVFWWPTYTASVVSDDAVNTTETAALTEDFSNPVNSGSLTLEPSSTSSADGKNVPEEAALVSDATSEKISEAPQNDLVESASAGAAITETVTESVSDTVQSNSESTELAGTVNSSETNIETEKETASLSDATLASTKEATFDHEVDISFSGDCWTEVRSADGKILYSGVKSAGSRLELTGNAPYRVTLGYAKGVSSLKYKGEEFDFAPFTRKSLARFELK